MVNYDKPIPHPDPITEEFWKATNRHEFIIQRCKECNEYIFYPREFCPSCLSPSLNWVKASGRGKVYSYTVVRQAFSSGFKADVPYIVAIVELEEGPRLLSNLVSCRIENVRINMPVAAVFEDITPEISLVKFKPFPIGKD